VAAGNVCIVRPSEKVPATSAVMARIVADVFPEDEAGIVLGGVDAADALLELPFDHIFFTGSTAVGRKVMHAAADHLASVTLELGGKSPAIVDRSADVAQAAERIVWGKFVNAGQTCVAPDYVLVHEADAPAFLAAATRAIHRFYGAGDEGPRASEDFARIVDDRGFRRLADALAQTVAEGATVVAGGATDAADRYVAPTILTDVRPDAPVMREEIFGPILPVLPVRSLDEALAFVNARPKPLALYVFTEEPATQNQVLEQTTSGGVAVNDTLMHYMQDDLPFGGVGPSGIGVYHSEEGFNTFSHLKPVFRQASLGGFTGAQLLYPPYGKVTKVLLQLMRKI
jgi:aldehyde dehydrogenase (NAD+)